MMSARAGLTILRFVLGIAVGAYSLELIVTQLRSQPHHLLLILAVAELAGAVLFLIPRTLRLGGLTLIAVFAAASLFHVLHGDYNSVGFLAVYGAAALAVVANRRPYER